MKIGLYQNAPKHTEIMGTFIEFCKIINAECIIYTVSDIDKYSFVNYYVGLIGHRKTTFKKPDDIIKDYKNLDRIIVNTNSDLLPKDFEKKEEIWKKIIYVSHQNYHNKKFMLNNIVVSPNIDGEHYKNNMTRYILPIYKANNFCNVNKNNIYAIVGALREHGHDREIRHLLKICQKYKNTERFIIYLFMRKDDFKRFKARCPSLVNNPLIKIFKGLGSDEMLNIMRTVKFIMPLAKDGGWFHTQRLTGTIPLALNNNIPLIIDKKLNDIYGLKGNICYDFDDNDEDFMNKFEVSLSINKDLYSKMIIKSMRCKNKIVERNIKNLKDFIDYDLINESLDNTKDLEVEKNEIKEKEIKEKEQKIKEREIQEKEQKNKEREMKEKEQKNKEREMKEKPMDDIINAVKNNKKAISEDMFGINNSIDRIINSSKGNLENTESQLIKNMKKGNKKFTPKIISTVGMSKEVMEKKELEKQQEVINAEKEKMMQESKNVQNPIIPNTDNSITRVIENQKIIINDLQLIKSKLFNL